MPKGECIFISGNAQVPVLKLIDATFSTKICLNSMEILFDDFFDDLQELQFLAWCILYVVRHCITIVIASFKHFKLQKMFN